jgi:hypothetical protein
LNTIYYCASGPAVAGGQHVNAEHVAELRRAGLQANLLHIPSSTTETSFQSIAPVVKMTANQDFQKGDVIVIPESWPAVIKYFSSSQTRKIIHCQNPYYLFHSFDSIAALSRHGFQEIITCSGFTEQMLRQFGFKGELHTVRPAIDEVFLRRENAPKKLQIAFMPRKRGIETQFIKGLFRSQYPDLNHINWVPVENKTRSECATILKESAVFASFSFLEGLGLPPLEAMASGCIVVGFHGLGGKEYANTQNGFWIEEGDYFGFVQQISQALKAAQDSAWNASISNAARNTIEMFTRESFNNDLLATWKKLLGKALDSYRIENNDREH